LVRSSIIFQSSCHSQHCSDCCMGLASSLEAISYTNIVSHLGSRSVMKKKNGMEESMKKEVKRKSENDKRKQQMIETGKRAEKRWNDAKELVNPFKKPSTSH